MPFTADHVVPTSSMQTMLATIVPAPLSASLCVGCQKGEAAAAASPLLFVVRQARSGQAGKVHCWPCQDGSGHMAIPGPSHSGSQLQDCSQFWLQGCSPLQDGPSRHGLVDPPRRGPMAPIATSPSRGRKESSHHFFFLKYVIVEVLPDFLLGCTVTAASQWAAPRPAGQSQLLEAWSTTYPSFFY